jgi:16S rRNA (uracil1498-N3)-methyltransferase
MTRVFVDCALTPGSQVELPPEPAAHLAKVLRVRSGDELTLFNGDGREFAGAVEAVRGSRVNASVGAARCIERESPLAITLLQCLPRGDRMDLVVQKATELGVTRIQPFLSRRSVVRLDAKQAGSKTQHWRAIAINACEQCGRNRLPVIDPPLELIDHLSAAQDSQAYVPRLRLVLEPGMSEALPHHPGGGVEIAIGPEGGFAPEELEAMRLAGFQRVALGPRILRTETAAIAAIAWLQSRYGDMRHEPCQGPT